jgi:hypothetical protein
MTNEAFILGSQSTGQSFSLENQDDLSCVSQQTNEGIDIFLHFHMSPSSGARKECISNTISTIPVSTLTLFTPSL